MITRLASGRAARAAGALALAASVAFAQGGAKPAAALVAREDAYRANNLGVALLEQYKYKDAADQFAKAIKLDDKLAITRINYAIALYNIPEADAAAREAKVAVALAPNAPQPHYILGLIARTATQPDVAVDEFKKVLATDPTDVGANVNLGQTLLQLKRNDEAIAVFTTAMQAEPYNVTAIYNLGQAYIRTGRADDGKKLLAQFSALRASGAGTSIGNTYLEQGRYAEAVTSTGNEPDLVNAATPAVKLAAAATVGAKLAAAGANPEPTATALVDLDGDGDLDLVVAGPAGVRLFAWDKGAFVDKTADSGLPSGAESAVVGGDYDNDTKPDLLFVGPTGFALLHNDGAMKFSDKTAAAKIPAFASVAYSCAFVDADHDGDLDVFVPAAGGAKPDAKPGGPSGAAALAPASNVLLRNNGDGTFVDYSVESKLAEPKGRALAVVPTDFDNRRDVDLLVAGEGEAPRLYRNLRDGSFTDVATAVGLGPAASFSAIAAADLNKDGYPDYYFASPNGPGRFALSDGKVKFTTSAGPAGSENASAATFVDVDNDGLVDLVEVVAGKLAVFRNVGAAGWTNVSDAVVTKELSDALASRGGASRGIGAADFDGDGDEDLVVPTAGGEAVVVRNDGGSANRSLAMRLAGHVSNRSGVGAKVEMRAGSLRERLETYSASPAPAASDVLFGLGQRASADAVRILWPTGIVQAETEFPKASSPGAAVAAMPVTELDRKPSSCPFLYAWNGEKFEFVTDFMGGGEMGSWAGPGAYNTSDPDEYVRIPPEMLKVRDGRVDLRVTNELEEVLFLDRLQLVAVSHPADVEVYPEEGLLPARPEYWIFRSRGARPPVAAHDDAGRDVLSSLVAVDRDFVKTFQLDSVRGYAAEHSLTLDLGDVGDAPTTLLLTGWTDYAFSSDNLGKSQAGRSLSFPSLQVKDEKGAWKTVIEDIGIPIGRPQTLVVDLAGKWLSSSREVRIVTNARVYWDRILVDTANARPELGVVHLDPTTADLRWRGFSRAYSPDHVEPWTYDYDDVSTTSTWKLFEGRYTREGDVRKLLKTMNDTFVVSRTGDEIALSFDVSKLPPLPEGWTRTYLLYADGFSKEMDPNSASPYTVEPLPFHGMSSYPYPETEKYPMGPMQRAYIDRYNTRVVRGGLQPLDASIAP